MERESPGVEVLTRAECLRLLSRSWLGRLALSTGALPVVVPVQYVLRPSGVVLRIGQSTRLDAAVPNAVVAFGVDEIDLDSHMGWSVMVTGVARELTDVDDLSAASGLPPANWSTDDSPEHYVIISLDVVNGRRFHMAKAPVER
jgi:uncharacterized protein